MYHSSILSATHRKISTTEGIANFDVMPGNEAEHIMPAGMSSVFSQVITACNGWLDYLR